MYEFETAERGTAPDAMAFQSDQDTSDDMLIFHEMPAAMLGNEIDADCHFINRLTKQMTVTIHPVKDGGTRRTTTSVNSYMATMVGALGRASAVGIDGDHAALPAALDEEEST